MGTATEGAGRSGYKGGASDITKRQMQEKAKEKIQDRPFCTQRCLLGLASGKPVDKGCPNFSDHQRQHINLPEFLRLIQDQLAKDRGPDADAMPLYLSGSVGALFKIRLSSHGYTLSPKV